MTDRIKKFAEQNGFIHKWMSPGEQHDKLQSLEKFAELIVRECARTAAMFSMENKRIHPDIDPHDMPEANRMVYHSTCQSVANEIKEHFGVQE